MHIVCVMKLFDLSHDIYYWPNLLGSVTLTHSPFLRNYTWQVNNTGYAYKLLGIQADTILISLFSWMSDFIIFSNSCPFHNNCITYQSAICHMFVTLFSSCMTYFAKFETYFHNKFHFFNNNKIYVQTHFILSVDRGTYMSAIFSLLMVQQLVSGLHN